MDHGTREPLDTKQKACKTEAGGSIEHCGWQLRWEYFA